MKIFQILVIWAIGVFNLNAQVAIDENVVYLITRSTNAKRFFIAKDFNTSDSLSTHIGLGIVEDSKLKIYHITPEAKVDESALFTQTLEEFIEVADVHSYAIWAKNIAPEDKRKLSACLNLWIRDTIYFDFDFDLNNRKWYCSEFVWEVLKTITPEGKNFKPVVKELDNFYQRTLGKKTLTYIPIDFFMDGNDFKKVKQIYFK